jgi:hypothetical protein
MEKIVSAIKNFARSIITERKINLPNGAMAHVSFDAAGNEIITYARDRKILVGYQFASVKDFLGFLTSIPKLYDEETVKGYREIHVYVDGKDIPNEVAISSRTLDISRQESSFELNPHKDFTRWMGAKSLSQMQFRTLLLELANQHDAESLPNMLSHLTYKTEINYEATVMTERNISLAYSEKEMVGSIEIPKFITVNTPVFSGTSHIQKITFEIVLVKPKNAGEAIKFSLLPDGISHEKILEEAAIWVVEEELLKPAAKIIETYAELVAPLYLRREVTMNVTELNAANLAVLPTR